MQFKVGDKVQLTEAYKGTSNQNVLADGSIYTISVVSGKYCNVKEATSANDPAHFCYRFTKVLLSNKERIAARKKEIANA